VTILAGVDAGVKMLVPFAGSLAANAAVDSKARTIPCQRLRNSENLIRRINISLLPDLA
jgi:hypothetical protein